MKETTENLLKELKNKNLSLQSYIERNPDSFIVLDIKEFWDGLISKTGKSKADIINKSDISYSYFYDIISGKKMPTIDMVVRVALAMHLTLDETNEALRHADRRMLSPRIKRDAAMIKAISCKYTVMQCNNLLSEINEEHLK